MSYTCELCGEPTNQKIVRKIEGVKMLVCHNCMMMGEAPKKSQRTSSSSTKYQKSTPKYYLDKPQAPSYTRKAEQKIRKSTPKYKKPSAPIDRLQLIANYRNILKRTRRDHNLDQAAFAGSVGITQTSYRHIESGKLELTIQEAKRIEKKYNIDLTELISDYEEDVYDQYMHQDKTGPSLGDVYLKRKK
jgi:uncharacterized protein (TIGR00270 family)